MARASRLSHGQGPVEDEHRWGGSPGNILAFAGGPGPKPPTNNGPVLWVLGSWGLVRKTPSAQPRHLQPQDLTPSCPFPPALASLWKVSPTPPPPCQCRFPEFTGQACPPPTTPTPATHWRHSQSFQNSRDMGNARASAFGSSCVALAWSRPGWGVSLTPQDVPTERLHLCPLGRWAQERETGMTLPAGSSAGVQAAIWLLPLQRTSL